MPSKTGEHALKLLMRHARPAGIAANSTPEIETVVFADLRLDDLARGRNAGAVQNLKDRRFDLYESRWARNPDALP